MSEDRIREVFDLVRECQDCAFKKRGFTFYADHASGYKYMLILQNPLWNPKRYKEEKEKAEQARDLEQRVRVHQGYMLRWFLSRNERFIIRFLDLCKKYRLIEYGNPRTYIEDRRFFEDFYVTDLIKYWCKTQEIKDEHLRHAIDHLATEVDAVKPNLAFVFGTRVWETFQDRFHPEPCQELTGIDPERGDNRVSNVHSYLFSSVSKSIGHKFFVIPLAHMSERARYMLLRDSYFEYLEDGLRCFSSLALERVG